MYDEYISTWVKQQTALLIFLLHSYNVTLNSKTKNHFTPKGISWVHHLVTGIQGNGTKPTFPGKRIPPSPERHHLYHNAYVHSSDSDRFNRGLSFPSSVCTHTHAHLLNPAPDNELPWWFLSLVGISLVFSVGVSLNTVCPSL